MNGQLHNEFNRVREDSSREYLTLDEVVQFKLPEINAMAALLLSKLKDFAQHEFEAQVRGFALLKLWEAIKDDRASMFQTWMKELLSNNMQLLHFEKYPQVLFVNRDTLTSLYRLLHVQVYQGLDFQAFLDLLQQAGEEMELLDLKDETMDDVVPLPAVERFIAKFTEGLISIFKSWKV